jgi:beta-phosphoglucomutase-like phosphatase (HAD superfamily)
VVDFMLKAILFDVDGTLAETEELHRRAFNLAFAEHGLEIEWNAEEYRERLRVTGGRERLARYFQLRGIAMDDARIAAIHATKNARYAAMLAGESVRLRTGARRLIEEAREARLKLGIVTTTSAVNLDALLGPLLGDGSGQWTSGFDSVVTGDEVARKKPAPDAYELCLQRLGIAAADAIAIEDSPAGVASARAAGIAVLAAPSRFTLGEDFSEADMVVPDLGEPDSPWLCPAPGFPHRWVDVEGLREVVALAQGTRRPAGAAPVPA